MREDEKKVTRVLYLIGTIPITWFALLIAPYTKGGLTEIIKNISISISNPFKIIFVENSIRTVLVFLLIYIL